MTDQSVFENKTAAYYTLGCKLNFAETSAIGRSLLEQGIRTARQGEEADICIINTCSVTSRADKECRQTIRQAHREHPNAFIVVTGCYAQLSADEIIEIEGVNLVLGAKEKLDVAKFLGQLSADDLGSKQVARTQTEDILSFSPSVSSEERTRHFLKVQDGCDYKCTYCTIPKARGKSRNGDIQSLTEMARRVASEGGKEIVLTGVNIGDFGRSTGEKFLDLLKALDEVEGIERYRISSIEPNLLKDEVIHFVSTSQRFAPYFHLPLQSGSDEVLKLMRRRYNTKLFRERIETIRQLMPDAFIGIDVIVGTRGELPEYFEESYQFLSEIDFSQLHVFSYSERAGTAALEIPYIVDPREKHKRSQRLHQLSDEHLFSFYERFVGSQRPVLWEEGNRDGQMFGFTDNYVRVSKPYDAGSVGKVELCVPTGLSLDLKALIL